jgi:DNA-binding NarL/FixJ family response regulator
MSAAMEKITVLIADDHALFRDGVKALLAATPDILVVGEAASGSETLALSETLHPDIVLMDINMPEINGIEATRRILQRHPNMGIIMVTMLEDDASVFAAMRTGARGYVLKGSHHDEMLHAIRAVARGEALFGPGIARRITHFFQVVNANQRDQLPQGVFPELTARELEVLELIARGLKNIEIAERLVISPKTVRNYISIIFSKLQVADRVEAVLQARQAGLGIEPDHHSFDTS